MIVGRIGDGERTVRMNIQISCTNCGKGVPGGIRVSEIFSATEEFQSELKNLRDAYLCGICRDKKRTGRS